MRSLLLLVLSDMYFRKHPPRMDINLLDTGFSSLDIFSVHEIEVFCHKLASNHCFSKCMLRCTKSDFQHSVS